MKPDYNQISEQELYECSVAYVRGRGKASTSLLQRHFYLCYAKAHKLIERMEQEGIISEPEGKLYERRIIG